MRYKLIFSDIDGTLLDSSHQVSENTRSAILELDRQGIPFILVSARMPDGITTIRQHLGNRAPIVCYSGGLIYGESDDILYSSVIELEQAAAAKHLIDTRFPKVCCSTYGYHKWLVDDKTNPWVQAESEITGLIPLEGGIDEIFAEDGGIHKFLLMGEAEEIRNVGEQLKQLYPEYSISLSKDTYLEITPGNVKKSAAVLLLCERCGVTIEEVLAFGDGENDIDMLEAVPGSYAMGNAPAVVKDSAAHVALDNNHEGLWHVLREKFSGLLSISGKV